MGVGCFWFGIKGGRPARWEQEFNPSEHLEKTKQALSRITNIDAIFVPENDEDIAVGHGNPLTLTAISNDFSFFPAYALVLMSFRIYLPRRLQNELARRSENTPIETETFNVFMYYDIPMPFTLIHYDTDHLRPNPSDAVVVIRRYLEREFKDDFVTFNSLGPSPFHADFSLKQNDSDDAYNILINDVSERGAGYKRFELMYPHSVMSEGRIIQTVVSEIGPFLSSYYALERDRINLMYLTEIANNHLSDLIDIEETRGLRRVYNQLFRAPTVISSILTSILNIEIEKSRANRFLAERQREKELAEDTPLYIFIERQIAGRGIYHPGETQEIVRLCEGRRLKLAENLAVLVAGLLGGIVGALLTWAISTHA